MARPLHYCPSVELNHQSQEAIHDRDHHTSRREDRQTPLTRDEVKRMLRDAAYVLHLTRRVKAEIDRRAAGGGPLAAAAAPARDGGRAGV